MKTQLTLSQKQTLKVINLIGIMMFALLSFNPTYAQTNSTPTKEVISNERTIKGLVSTEDGALPGVNIVLQGTRTGVNTDSNGEFTFPVKLKTGDVLIPSRGRPAGSGNWLRTNTKLKEVSYWR